MTRQNNIRKILAAALSQAHDMTPVAPYDMILCQMVADRNEMLDDKDDEIEQLQQYVRQLLANTVSTIDINRIANHVNHNETLAALEDNL